MKNSKEYLLKIVIKWAAKKMSMQKSILQKAGKGNSRLIKKLGYTILTPSDGSIVYKSNIPENSIFVDQGRKAGSRFPPLNAILQWMKRKNLNPKLSFIIRRSVAKKGIRPIKFLDAGHIKTPEYKTMIAELKKAYKEYVLDKTKEIIISEFKNKIS